MPTTFYVVIVVGSVLMLVWLSRGPFFVPTRRKHVPRIIELLHIKPGEKMVDLGSGDGRLVAALANAGAEAHGYEHNPFLVMCSRIFFRKNGLEKKAFIHRADFWSVDVSSFDGVVIFGIPYIMAKLEKKLRKELRPGARVVSYSFRFPNWEPIEKEGGIYLYRQQ